MSLQYQEKTQSKLAKPMKTGELLVKEGLVCLDDIDMALSIQEEKPEALNLKRKRLLGMILCDLNLITPLDNYYVLHKYNKLATIQSTLVSRQILSEKLVSKTLKASQEQDIPFISALLKTELISTTGMQRVLFDLFHLPFRSISDFIFNEKDREALVLTLDKHGSLENKMIPLVVKKNTILFGITDPENMLFLRRLNGRFPQYRFKALFIPFSGFSWFHKIIYDSHKGKAEPAPKQDALDLSLLLSFKTSIKDPENQSDAIRILYERYELLRHLIGHPKQDHRQREFSEFILQTHRKISFEYGTAVIEFSLKNENQDVKLIAFPKR